MNFSWLLLMAWRDSRRNRSRLLLFISSIILGIAALVAIYSLGDNMRSEIDKQATSLIGADLEISGSKEFPDDIKKLADSLGDQKSEERDFSSMIYFPKNEGTRLVQVRALKGAFPYYGVLETTPASSGIDFRNQRRALVDQTLMLQFDAKVGDSVKVGNVTFAIAGTLLSAPGQTGLSASVAPIVYIPLQYLAQTGLSQKGSRINYKYYFKYDRPVDMKALLEKIEPRLEKENLNFDTVESQKQDTNRSFSDLTRFLSLVGFIALLLGCVGVASAIHIYVREKINAIAILRCMGARGSQAFLIYLIQIIIIGFAGSVIGAALGTIIQQFLPVVLKDLLPITIATPVSWSAIIQGLIVGVIISILFALLPLISIRNISPLNTLRLSYEATTIFKDPVKWLVYLLILLFIFGFTYQQLHSLKGAFFFSIGVLLAFLILAGMASLLIWLVRRFFPENWSYLWRQGLANLFRPNNQTTILIVAIGLGTAFICTLFFIQSILLNRVNLSASGNQSNTVLFDIQTAQKDKVVALARQFNLPVERTVPIVNITGKTLEKDSSNGMQRWIFSREYRATFRDSLTASEKITDGKWVGSINSQAGIIYISLEERYAKRNRIKVGDTMVFNVQGSILSTLVGSFRAVDWNRIQTNFIVVFPKGVLEDAPQFHVLLTHVPDKQTSARFQQSVVRQFPNVSIIDLGLILSILDKIMDKIGFVIRFMAGFSMITGLIVLISSVIISKYQRIQESVLLRTLGASRKQIFVIMALEYFFLGALAAATGIILAVAGSWALARYSFDTSFTPAILPMLTVFFSVCSLTVVIGLANSRSVVNRPPLEILREEV